VAGALLAASGRRLRKLVARFARSQTRSICSARCSLKRWRPDNRAAQTPLIARPLHLHPRRPVCFILFTRASGRSINRRNANKRRWFEVETLYLALSSALPGSAQLCSARLSSVQLSSVQLGRAPRAGRSYRRRSRRNNPLTTCPPVRPQAEEPGRQARSQAGPARPGAESAGLFAQ